MRAFYSVVVILTGINSAFGQSDWRLRKEEGGIKIYTQDDPHSDFKRIKVDCTIKAGLTQLAAALLDVEAQHDWMYNNKYSKPVKKIAPNELTYYSEVSVPWPYQNRDLIAHFTVAQPAAGLMTVDSHGEPDALPENEGKVRVKKSVAHWDITRLADQQLRIVYTVQFDPSGAVPAWLTNLFIAKGPYETFSNLRNVVSRPKYAHARLDFIKD